jgi:hypothetical protein
MSGTVAVPSYKELLWPTVRAVREIGDSGTIEEIVEKVIELEGFTEEQPHVACHQCQFPDRSAGFYGSSLPILRARASAAD